MDNETIELTDEVNSMRDAGTEARLAWLQNAQAQEDDGAGAIKIAMGILIGCVMAIVCALLSGCSAYISINIPSLNRQEVEVIGLDGEPMGAGDSEALERMLEDRDNG